MMKRPPIPPRFRVVSGVLALERFSVSHLADFTGLPPTTVRKELNRLGDLIALVGHVPTPGKRGQPAIFAIAPRSQERCRVILQEELAPVRHLLPSVLERNGRRISVEGILNAARVAFEAGRSSVARVALQIEHGVALVNTLETARAQSRCVAAMLASSSLLDQTRMNALQRWHLGELRTGYADLQGALKSAEDAITKLRQEAAAPHDRARASWKRLLDRAAPWVLGDAFPPEILFVDTLSSRTPGRNAFGASLRGRMTAAYLALGQTDRPGLRDCVADLEVLAKDERFRPLVIALTDSGDDESRSRLGLCLRPFGLTGADQYWAQLYILDRNWSPAVTSWLASRAHVHYLANQDLDLSDKGKITIEAILAAVATPKPP